MKKLSVVLLGLAACSSTSILSTWKKPGLQSLQLNSLVVVVPVKDTAMRRRAEDALVSALAPKAAVPSYRLLPEGATDQQLRDRIKQGDFDGAVVMHVRSVDQEASWVPGVGGFYGGLGAPGWYDPGFVTVDTFVRVETSIYALPDEDLLWSASSRTANPASVSELVDEVVAAVRDEMKREGIAPLPVSQRAAPGSPLASF